MTPSNGTTTPSSGTMTTIEEWLLNKDWSAIVFLLPFIGTGVPQKIKKDCNRIFVIVLIHYVVGTLILLLLFKVHDFNNPTLESLLDLPNSCCRIPCSTVFASWLFLCALLNIAFMLYVW